MMRILRKNDYQSQPWKNGGGVTSQIGIYPEDAKFPGDPFVWRVSTAQVTGSGPFSTFPEYERILLVCEGAGLVLNGKKHLPFVPFRFSGNEAIDCSLIAEPVTDLGIIYRPDQVGVEIEILTLNPSQPQTLELEEGTHFLFGAKGTSRAENIVITAGDCLRVDAEEDETSLGLSATTVSKLVRVSLFL